MNRADVIETMMRQVADISVVEQPLDKKMSNQTAYGLGFRTAISMVLELMKMRSKCCFAPVYIASSDEGTNSCICAQCSHDCDIVKPKKDIKKRAGHDVS